MLKRSLMTDIIVADNYELIRSGLQLILQQNEHFHIAAEATSFSDLLVLLEDDHFDLLILDFNLGDKNGLETIDIIRRAYPMLPILILSSFPEENYAIHALKAGASGYLNKSVFSSELLMAIEKVAAGKKFISESLSEKLLYGLSLDKDQQNPVNRLSKREFEVLTLFASGKKYKEIATQLDLSPKTVSTYRTRIMDKLDLSTTAQLLRFAYEHNLCD